jgi:hypothetical protein
MLLFSTHTTTLTAVNGRSPSFFIARKWGRIETMDLITLEGGATIENVGGKIRGWGREERCRERKRNG